MTNLRGQAVLIVLLSMVVVLTIVLSVIGSSTSDISLGTTESASLRAFSAAESGIEKSLVTNLATSGNVNSGASYDASVISLAQGAKSYIYPQSIVNGDGATFWFVSHDAATQNLTCAAGNTCFTGKAVNFCWGIPGTSGSSATTPALEISVFYLNTPGNYTTTRVGKDVYDPNSSRRSTNNYNSTDSGTCTIGNTTFAFQKKVDLSTNSHFGVSSSAYNAVNGLQFMIVKPLYSVVAEPIGIDVNYAGNGSLPAQGSLVSSTGNQGQTTRKIEVTRAYNQVPPIFDVAIFSPGGLVQ
ncbi:hypothetical protein BH10PAT1_BH10PAT1_4290 [soil metagenome]